MKGALEVLGSLLSGSILKSLANDDQLYNDLGIERQSLVNWRRQQEINQQNMDFQREMNALNIQNSWDMWNATNEYNSPAAQMARYKAAGLNPNLIYGQSNTASAVSIPTAQAAKMESYDSKDPIDFLPNVIGMIAKIPMVFNQLKNQQLQNDNIEKDNSIKAAMANYWNSKADNEAYKTSKELFYSALYSNAHQRAFFDSKEMDTIANMWLENLKEGLRSNALKNKVMDYQAAYNWERKKFEELRNKYYGGYDNSKGIFELQRDMYDVSTKLKGIDLDFQEMTKWTKNLGPWGNLLINFLKFMK